VGDRVAKDARAGRDPVSGQPDEQGGVRLITEPHDGHRSDETCPGCPHSTPCAPTGDHGGLRAAVEALAERIDDEAGIAAAMKRAGQKYRLRSIAADVRALAAHPEPEPAQDGEVAAVLAAHAGWRDSGRSRTGERVGKDERWFCSCGEQLDDESSGRGIVQRHRAHLAAVLVAAGVTR
jgi:hypothetical protein